jgi:hypothetical protein
VDEGHARFVVVAIMWSGLYAPHKGVSFKVRVRLPETSSDLLLCCHVFSLFRNSRRKRIHQTWQRQNHGSLVCRNRLSRKK